MGENTHWSNDEWRKSISDLRLDDDVKRAAFFERLWRFPLFVPRGADNHSIATLGTQDNRLFLPAFTDKAEYGKWQGGAEPRICAFSMLNGMVIDDSKLSGIVINPFSQDCQLVLPREALKTVENAATGMTTAFNPHSGKTILAAAKYPPALAHSFVRALKNSGMTVFEAFILNARQEHEKTSHLMFLIDFNGDRKHLFPNVARQIQPHMKNGAQFELMKANLSLLSDARTKTKPVYKV